MKNLKNKITLILAIGAVISLSPAVSMAKPLCDGAKSACIERFDKGHEIGILETKGWAFYCPAEYPYGYSFENASDDWVSASFNPILSNNTKLQLTFTNWSFSQKRFGAHWACTKEQEFRERHSHIIP